MSYSRLGSTNMPPQRAVTTAKKPALRIGANPSATLATSAIKPMTATYAQPKTTLVVGANAFKPAQTLKPATTVAGPVSKPPARFLPPPKPPAAPPPPASSPGVYTSPEEAAEAGGAWADWGGDSGGGSPVVTETYAPEHSYAPDQSVVQEPSQAESLAPKKPLPWAWIALGLTATALLGYAVYKRKPVSPNRVRRNARRRRRARDAESELADHELREGRKAEREWEDLRRALIAAGLEEEHHSVTKDIRRMENELTRALRVQRTGHDAYGRRATVPSADYVSKLRRKISDFNEALGEIEAEAKSSKRAAARRGSSTTKRKPVGDRW